MAYRALSDVMLGTQPPAHAGELIPDTYTDLAGSTLPVDFDRLVAAGVAEKVTEPKPRRAKVQAG